MSSASDNSNNNKAAPIARSLFLVDLRFAADCSRRAHSRACVCVCACMRRRAFKSTAHTFQRSGLSVQCVLALLCAATIPAIGRKRHIYPSANSPTEAPFPFSKKSEAYTNSICMQSRYTRKHITCKTAAKSNAKIVKHELRAANVLGLGGRILFRRRL